MTTEPTLPLVPPTFDPAVDHDPAPTARATPAGPRVRWAGIVWGAVLAAVAASALWLLADPGRYAPVREWVLALSPETFHPGVIAGVVILIIGVLLLIGGGIALLRRAQLRATITP